MLSGKRAVLEEGKDEDVIQERQHSVIVRSEDSDDVTEWPFPGFSREIIGLAGADEKSITYTYPEDSSVESLAGTPVEFHVKVEEIKSRSLPDLDDDFAQTIGDFETLSELRNEAQLPSASLEDVFLALT